MLFINIRVSIDTGSACLGTDEVAQVLQIGCPVPIVTAACLLARCIAVPIHYYLQKVIHFRYISMFRDPHNHGNSLQGHMEKCRFVFCFFLKQTRNGISTVHLITSK